MLTIEFIKSWTGFENMSDISNIKNIFSLLKNLFLFIFVVELNKYGNFFLE